MTENPAAPDFDEAVRRFQAFLRTKGWPEALVWVSESDVFRTADQTLVTVRDERARTARESYELAVQRRLGVAMEAVCTLEGATCATVALPSNSLDAEYRMYPADGGLKLSVPSQRVRGSTQGGR